MNASCATRTPEVRVLGTFPARLSAVTPATARAGNRAGLTARRLAAVAAAATGDAVWRWYYGDGVRAWGLRGGTLRYGYPSGSVVGIALHQVRWTADTRVSGTVRWDQGAGLITAALTVTGPHGTRLSLRLRYLDYVPHSTVTLAGQAGSGNLSAVMPAP
jgi:hypothetical protein